MLVCGLSPGCGVAGPKTPLERRYPAETRRAAAPEDLSGMRAEALDSPPGLAALRRWAARDRPAALNWLAGRHPAPRFTLAAAIEGWIAADPGAVARYLASCSDAAWRGAVTDAVVLDALAEHRPQTALALLARFPGSAEEKLLRETARSLWTELDPAADARVAPVEALFWPRPDKGAEIAPAEAEISLADFALAVREDRALVLDARSAADYGEARVPGALSWPAGYFEGSYLRHAAALSADPARPIIVYCADGGCGASQLVLRELRRAGYARAVVYPGGWAGWLEAGLPVEPGEKR